MRAAKTNKISVKRTEWFEGHCLNACHTARAYQNFNQEPGEAVDATGSDRRHSEAL